MKSGKVSENVFRVIYKIVKKIPKGKVVTYGQIAKKIKDFNFSCKVNPKIVGFALHVNKDLSVPCHRVVNKEGKIAESYAFGAKEGQRKKLVSEGVNFLDEVRVDLKKHLWKL